MEINEAFGKALKKLRTKRGMTQESFSLISSRTYLSSLERGLKSPTIEKIDSISKAMKVHPLTLLALAYTENEKDSSVETILKKVKEEIHEIS